MAFERWLLWKEVKSILLIIKTYLFFLIGEPDKKSGILPSLISFRVVDFMSREAKLDMAIERPIKVNANVDLCRQVVDVFDTLRKASGLDEIAKIVESGKVDGSKETLSTANDFDFRNQFCDISKMTFSTKQLVVQITDNSRYLDNYLQPYDQWF